MGEPPLARCTAVLDTAERTAHVFTFDGYLRFWAQDRPDRRAIDACDAVINYAELDRITAAVAAGLADLGLVAGDRMAWQGRDAGLFLALLFGAARCGVVMVPIAPDCPGAMADAIAADAGVKAVFTGSGSSGGLANVRGVVRQFDAAGAWTWIAGQSPRAFPLAAPNAPVLQLYDHPARGVVLSHCNLLALRKAVLGHNLPHVVPGDDEVLLVAMPCWRISGIGPAVLALAAGLTVAVRDAEDTAAQVEALAACAATRLYCAPGALERMVHASAAAQIVRGQLRYITCGADPVPAGLRRALRSRFGAELIRSYGLPETAGTVATLSPHDQAGASAVGRPLPGVEVRITDGEGNAQPPGHAGRIAVRSAGSMLGYWCRNEATAAVRSPDGWIMTGDAGHLDRHGILHLG